MPSDTLSTLLRLREAGRDGAQQDLARAIGAESEAVATARAADQAIADEQAAATDTAAGDQAVDAFARWLPRGRAAARTAWEAADQAQARVGQARAVLSAAQAALEAALALSAERVADARRSAAQREQREADEAGSRRIRGQADGGQADE